MFNFLNERVSIRMDLMLGVILILFMNLLREFDLFPTFRFLLWLAAAVLIIRTVWKVNE